MGASGGRLVERNLVGVGVGILMKFMLGSDDLVWLSPFMAKADLATKIKMGYKYVGTVFVLSTIAAVLAFSLQTASGSEEGTAEKVLGTLAGTLLLSYAAYMAHDEGYFERCSADVDAEDKGG